MFLRVVFFAAARGDARLRVLPAKLPERALVGLEVGFFLDRLPTGAVGLFGAADIAGFEQHARHFVGHVGGAGVVLLGEVGVNHLLLVLSGFLALALEGVGHRHGAQRARFLLG